MSFSFRKTPVRGERRTTWRAVLGGVPAMVGLVVLAAATALAQGKSDGKPTGTREFCGRLVGNFSAVAPAPLLTMADSVSGSADRLGPVTGQFTVTIDFNHPIAPGFALVSKEGSLVDADGDKIDLAMVGTIDVNTLDVRYVFLVTGGTGRFAGATGHGTWDVPPPSAFDKATGSGSGAEICRGTITVLRRN